MLFNLDLHSSDDIGFVHIVRPIMEGVVQIHEPSEIYLVKIANWFGSRWLSFSHKTLGALGIGYYELRVPPFVPRRVVSETFLVRRRTAYESESAPARLHIEQTSASNASRKVSALAPQAALFWWSGATRSNGRGSLMAHVPSPQGHAGWYAEFKKDGDWKVANALCTTAAEIASLAAASSGAS